MGEFFCAECWKRLETTGKVRTDKGKRCVEYECPKCFKTWVIEFKAPKGADK